MNCQTHSYKEAIYPDVDLTRQTLLTITEPALFEHLAEALAQF